MDHRNGRDNMNSGNHNDSGLESDLKKISTIEILIGALTVLLIIVLFLKLAKILILVTAAALIFLVSYRFFKRSADERNGNSF